MCQQLCAHIGSVANGTRVEHLPWIHRIAALQQSQEFLSKMSEEPEFTGRIIFMSMFNDISWRSKDNKIECESNAQLVSLFAKRFGARQWSFLGLGSEKKWYSISENSPQSAWDDSNCFTHNYFCKSAQSLRSSRRNVWRIRNFFW